MKMKSSITTSEVPVQQQMGGQALLPNDFSSFAFCPASNTISSGRGAKDDQYSYFAPAISDWIPAIHCILYSGRAK